MSEIEESLQETEKNVSNKIISSIRNMMSDRHTVQKKLCYFDTVPPNFVENWDTMNEDIQINFN